jgi:hypothetical protein
LPARLGNGIEEADGAFDAIRRAAELSLAQVRLNQLQNDSALFQALGGGV